MNLTITEASVIEKGLEISDHYRLSAYLSGIDVDNLTGSTEETRDFFSRLKEFGFFDGDRLEIKLLDFDHNASDEEKVELSILRANKLSTLIQKMEEEVRKKSIGGELTTYLETLSSPVDVRPISNRIPHNEIASTTKANVANVLVVVNVPDIDKHNAMRLEAERGAIVAGQFLYPEMISAQVENNRVEELDWAQKSLGYKPLNLNM